MRNLTEVISYNLNERGRSFTGVDRDIDIVAAMRLINSPSMQESVRKGDLYGYVGHGFREKYGLDVPETVIEGGKTIVLEPAVRTVLFKCMPDGTVQHRQEFLNTSPGRIAARLYASKAYGFSSAFYAPEENGKRTPRGYFGMDLVKSPNYDTNRGYDAMLDSVGAGAIEGEGFAAEYGAMMDSIDAILAANEEHTLSVNIDYLRVCKDNDDLADLSARLLIRLKAYEKGAPAGGMLDNANPDVLQRGHTYLPSRAAEMLDSARRFMSADLTGLEPEPKEKEEAGFLAKCRDSVNKIIGAA